MTPGGARRRVRVRHEAWPLAEAFTISRGSKTQADVVVVEIEADGVLGRGECVPYPRYDETIEGVIGGIESHRGALESGADRAAVGAMLPPGAARNAVDCALWDLESKRAGRRAWEVAGLDAPGPTVTAYTLSLGSPDAMGAAAARHADRPLLKLKLGPRDVVECVAAVRSAAPRARLIVDANEAWRPENLASWLPALAELGVELVEQPLPAGADEALTELASPVALGADESCHTTGDLDDVARRYQVINIKLDKTGGLTGALELRERARAAGLRYMVGCMVGTSLGMAPATLLCPGAAFVDLDGPLLMDRDREPGLVYRDGQVEPPAPELWG